MNRKLLHLSWMQLQFDTTKFWNTLVYYLRKLPIVGHLFGLDDFRFPRWKPVLRTLSPLHKLFSLAFGAGIGWFIATFLAGGATVIDDSILLVPNADRLMATRVWAVYFTTAMTNYSVISATERMYQLQHLFRFPPRDLARANFFIERFLHFIARTVFFALFLPGVTTLQAILLSTWILAISSISEAVVLLIFEKTHKDISEKTLVVIGSYVAGLALFVLVTILHVDLVPVLTNPVLVGIAAVLLVISFLYQWRFSHYSLLAASTIAAYQHMLEKVENLDPKTAGIKLKDKDLKQELNGDTIVGKASYQREGFSLLNHLFFKRHRRLLIKPVIIKTVITGILGIGLCILFVYLFATGEQTQEAVVQGSPFIFSFIPFIMYTLCNNENITKAMFANCDLALITHRFYREPDNILEMFKLRFRSLLKINALPTVVLMLSLLIWGFVIQNGIWINILTAEIMVASLGVFFTIHTLFMYYVFQPYNADLDVKNPVFSTVNFAIYLICFGLFQLQPKSFLLAPILIVATLIYPIVALQIIHKHATKTFRLR